METCPHCGQSLARVFYGVRFPPRKAQILDLIVRRTSSGNGLSLSYIAEAIYPDRAIEDAKVLCRTHIFQINSMLEETDVRVSKSFPSGYRVIKQCDNTR